MKQSTLFTKTRKEAPKDETAKNAQLLIRGGFIHKELAGVYSYLPLGFRVLEKVRNIIVEEMDAIGGQEVLLTTLQKKELWEKTGRFSDEVVDNWFKTKIKNGAEAGLGFTHEEPLTAIMSEHVSSYRDLPKYPYQIQTKFRNEERAKSGLLRGREFLMKDLYSFSKDEKEHGAFYEKATQAYKKIFDRVGIGELTHLTFASGGTFSKYSHEFQTVAEEGEDTIHVCEKCGHAVNDDVFGEQNTCPECGGSDFKKENSIEVGNIFNLGTKFSEPLGLSYKDENGEQKPVFMGSYGIGLGRLMATAVEVLSDDKGIVWPESIAPFQVHLLSLNSNDKARKVYEELTEGGVEVLYDDREGVSPGEKFSDSDLIGIPLRVVISEKTGDKVEVKKRSEEDAELISQSELLDRFRK